MYKTASVQKKPANPSNSPTVCSSAAKLGRHTAKSLSPALPRINQHSTFSQAFARAGFSGLLEWVIRAVEAKGMSVQNRLGKPKQIKAAFSSIIKQANRSKEWQIGVEKLLKDADWYEVDLQEEVDCTLPEMNVSQLHELKHVCNDVASLSWIASKINENLEAITEFADEEKLQAEVERKNLDLRAKFFGHVRGFQASRASNGIKPDQFEGFDQFLKSFGSLDKTINFDVILSKCSPAILLLLSEICRHGIPEDREYIKFFCKKAIEKIKNLEHKINCNELGDAEFEELYALAQDKVVAGYDSDCEREIQKRLEVIKIAELASHFKERLLVLMPGLKPVRNNNGRFGGMVSRPLPIASNIIARMDPADVVRLSKLVSTDTCDAVLIDAAKLYLVMPDLTLLDQKHLLAYLAIPVSEMSSGVPEKLFVELKKRVICSIEARFSDLMEGIKSDSYDSLIHAVREFSDRTKSAGMLERALKAENCDDFEKALGNARNQFSERLKELNRTDPSKIARARRLIVELRKKELRPGLHGEMAGTIADHLSIEIRKANYSFEEGFGKIASTSPQEIQNIELAILNYFPATSDGPGGDAAKKQSYQELSNELLHAYQSDLITDGQFKKVRTPDGEEIPVCPLFLRDQTKPTQTIYGQPVTKSYVPKDLDRARGFVQKMNDLGCTEEQIMTASQIASQGVGNPLDDLVKKEKLFPFLDGEIEFVGYNAVGKWLLPGNLSSYQNFERDENGILIAQVRLSTDNISSWHGAAYHPGAPNVVVHTNPEKSSFSARLRFEIGGSGEIKKCVLEDFVASREILQKLTLTHG